ncbi:MAG: radical SAM family heme chaperone HemW [Prevotellaceae bacterium]|jgi:oxygen-independent coproporphyrinogen-3 oxidase|nr:radical SAM family heme chaperone HemW [Prevotellaceae bacterium]
MPGLYIHIPFCKQLCSYCDFYFSVSLARTAEMLNCMMKEMDIRASKGEQLYGTPEPCTLYFGGGTPTVYRAGELKRLSEKAVSLFFPQSPSEWTVEANPDDLTEDYLRQLAETGVNRLSIGIQSFIDRDLQAMRRRHSARQAAESVRRAKGAGFGNISIDLIYGFPGMSLKEWEYCLDRALELNVEHISAYHLSIESKTVLGKLRDRGEFSPVDDRLSDLQYKMLERKLQDAGYVHYEISNFALPGFFSRHNSAYWNRGQYIGIGPSAHSYDGKCTRKSNVANNIRYIESISRGVVPETVETLSEKDIYNESLITSLRTAHGLDLNTVPEIFRAGFLKKAARYLNSGRMTYTGRYYAIPSQYFLISDSIISDFIEVDC